ncbi:hypothetical protein BJF86_15960 [Serinicoccus sp. CNJ-927]|nr:hypothetical protein BJF86_15960 [Serinicoccus sp. CNJ-927]
MRWFDADRGFGFIALGEDAEDLYVHASEIVSTDTTRVLREGQVVEFEIGEGARGPQTRRVRVTAEQPTDAPLGLLGTVSGYEPSKGYGFVSPDDGGDEIFLHSSAIVPGGLVSKGQRVAFLVVDGEKGPQARDVRLVGGSARRGAPARSTSRRRSGPRRSSDGPARGGQGVVALRRGPGVRLHHPGRRRRGPLRARLRPARRRDARPG